MRNKKLPWLGVLLLIAVFALLAFADPLAVLQMDRPNPAQSAPAR